LRKGHQAVHSGSNCPQTSENIQREVPKYVEQAGGSRSIRLWKDPLATQKTIGRGGKCMIIETGRCLHEEKREIKKKFEQRGVENG